jgi:hypothetical protein
MFLLKSQKITSPMRLTQGCKAQSLPDITGGSSGSGKSLIDLRPSEGIKQEITLPLG